MGTLLHSLISTTAARAWDRSLREGQHPSGQECALTYWICLSRKDSDYRKQQQVALLGTEPAGFEILETKDCMVTCLSGAEGVDLQGPPGSSQGRTGPVVCLYQYQ